MDYVHTLAIEELNRYNRNLSGLSSFMTYVYKEATLRSRGHVGIIFDREFYSLLM
jgi:uncharacterized lipoprotein YehR (DUF1307 family)